MRARASIAIDAPPDVVFSHVADFDSHATWRREILTSRTLGAPGVGMQIYQHVSLQGQQTLLTFEVTEWEPPERISFRYDGPPRIRGGFMIRPEGAGTHLTIFAHLPLSGAAEFAEDRIRSVAEAEARRSLKKLKTLIEGRGERDRRTH